MENVEIEDIQDVPEIVETQDEDENDTTDWKTIALERHEIAKRNTGIGKRWQTKALKAKEPVNPPVGEKELKKGFDYAELAYLEAKGISEEEHSFVLEKIKETGKELKDLLGASWFQSELKEKRELKATKDAIPEGTKRAGGATRDTVDYWLAKGELPPIGETELRRKVVNERIKREGEGSKFTTRPVA